MDIHPFGEIGVQTFGRELDRMPLFYFEYAILPSARPDVMTIFAGMTEEDDLKQLGDCRRLHRVHAFEESCGCGIFEVPDVKAFGDFMMNWKDMCTVKTTPAITDDELRKIILKTDPPFSRDYSKYYNAEPKEGESLYWIRFKFYESTKMQAYEYFGNMTEEQDMGDSGAVTPYLRLHMPSTGSGVIIASAPSAADVYGWAYAWAPMCTAEVTPVLHDKQVRAVVSSKPDFKAKHAAVMAKMGM